MAMEIPSLDDVKGKQLFETAKRFYSQHEYTKALEVTADLSFVRGKDKTIVDILQGNIFKDLAQKTENSDAKFTFFLASVESFSSSSDASPLAAISLLKLADQIGSVMYYKKCLRKAKEGLHVGDLEQLIKTAESRIAESKTRVGSAVKDYEQNVRKSENEETGKSDSDFVKGLRSYWSGLNVDIKRNFMKVSTAELASYVERLYGRKGRDALQEVLTYAKEDKKWRFWLCRNCLKKFSSAKTCKEHLGQEHAKEFKLSFTQVEARGISKLWGLKISIGDWKPVDGVAAVEMIKNRLEDVIAFAYENGWSKDWPLAADEEHGKLLQEIKLLLVSFFDRKILSCYVRDWVKHFVVKHLEKLEVSEHSLTECHLVETPQIICFLECPELYQILELLKDIKRERYDGTDLVCRAVDSFCNGTRVKEKIDFDTQFSFLLLDKRLLHSKIASFDDEGTINLFDPNVYYAKAHAHGDDILSWLANHSSGDERFRFPKPIRAQNQDIWMAVLRALQFTCRTVTTKYQKKFKLENIIEILTDAESLCIGEDERRRNVPEDQWKKYASLLCDHCEKLLTTNGRDSLGTKLELSAVRDVLKGASHPTIYHSELEDCMNYIRERKNVSDEIVLKSIDHLKLAVTRKIPLMDSKILLIKNSRNKLLDHLTRLSVFDYRSYILRPLKEFLLDEIVDMESKAKVAAAEADIFLVEERKPQSKKKKSKSNKVDMESKAKVTGAEANLLLVEEKKPQSKKKKNKSKKRTSMSMSTPIDKIVEQEHSVKLDPAEEDSMEPESGEEGRLENSSNADNQEQAAKDMQNLPREDSRTEHLESSHGAAATKYKSTLHMTLKGLCNIKVLKEYLVQNRHQFHDNQEERVPCALRNFFTGFVSKQIKDEGVYSCLLSDLLAAIQEVQSMSSDAAELLVSILEFWPSWKSPEIERVVTRIFTLEEYERMSCSKCRKKPNYPEQGSYGIVMAADSIRDLKFALGNIKFVDILLVIRMEDKMLCDIKTGGCGKANIVHHIISTCPPIFTIVLEWEKNETANEISETTKALDWEIDISRLYEGLEPNTKYRLVSMVGCGEEEEYIYLAYKKNRWVSFRHGASTKEVVGNWKSVVRFCGERKVRPEILFYEAVSMA